MIELVLKALSRLPFPLLYLLSDAAYLVMRYVSRYRLETVRENLRSCFPEKTEREIGALVNGFYRNFCDTMLEIAKVPAMSPAEIERRVSVRDAGVLEELVEADRPFLLVATHQCNWEWLVLGLGVRLPHEVNAVYQPLHDRRIDELLRESRSRHGGRLVPVKALFTELAKRRDSMKVIALVADQLPTRGEDKYWATFLGRDTAFYVGIEKLARVTRWPVVFAGVRRTRRGHYEASLRVIASPPYRRDDGDTVVERYVRETEKLILESPCDWLWSHRRWKYKKPLYA